MSLQTHSIAWKRLADRWERFYRPPGRPSKSAIEVYKKFMKQGIMPKGKKPWVLILGSTPELRTLAHSMGCTVLVADINEEFHYAMSSFVESASQERFIESDWRNLPLNNASIDIVLGDVVIQNIEFAAQDKFLQEMQRILRPNGLFISKMEVLPNDWTFMSFDEALLEYASCDVPVERMIEATCSIMNNSWDKRTNLISLQPVRKWMRKFESPGGEFFHENLILQSLLRAMWDFWQPMEKEWSFGFEKDLEKQIAPYFSILQRSVLHDCFLSKIDKNFPIWLCRKNGPV